MVKKRKFVLATWMCPKTVHLSAWQIAELKSDADKMFNMRWDASCVKKPLSIDGMTVVLCETDGPSFST